MLNPDDVTPLHIDNATGIMVKRDDIFSPFGPGFVNGGKARQFIKLLEKNRTLIQTKYNNTVIVQSSIFSSTISVVGEIASRLGFKSIVCVGGSKPEYFKDRPAVQYALNYGCDVRNVAGTGMSGPIYKRMSEIIESEQVFDLSLKHNADKSPECILCNQAQVANFPKVLDNLIVPAGSGMTFAGIVRGLQDFGITVNQLYVVGVGPDRSKSINELINPLECCIPSYKFVSLDTTYAKPEKANQCDIPLDGIYEAKVWNWMIKNVELTKNTLFWNSGFNPAKL